MDRQHSQPQPTFLFTDMGPDKLPHLTSLQVWENEGLSRSITKIERAPTVPVVFDRLPKVSPENPAFKLARQRQCENKSSVIQQVKDLELPTTEQAGLGLSFCQFAAIKPTLVHMFTLVFLICRLQVFGRETPFGAGLICH